MVLHGTDDGAADDAEGLQSFDHYLKGEPAPQWFRDGLPQVNTGGPVR